MRFALINNERVEATPKLKGLCPGCGQSVTAKCGKYRIWHWAHEAKKNCDKWWETETAWHRNWKDQFPREWQEKVHYDQSGEKHIADVKTSHDLVIEFQHSHLDPQERNTRESFYGNMLWVVNGARLKRDYPRFLKGKGTLKGLPVQGFYLTPFPEECFPSAWCESKVPVIFDFRGVAPDNPKDKIHETLWCLLPGRAEGHAVVARLSLQGFFSAVSGGSQLLPYQEIVATVAQGIRQQRENAAKQARSLFQRQFRRRPWQGTGRRRRSRF
ncbi:MAG: competence protein [Proteobacteria bacterium]|nr:competence protein [Pseudomonadota bacterium]